MSKKLIFNVNKKIIYYWKILYLDIIIFAIPNILNNNKIYVLYKLLKW